MKTKKKNPVWKKWWVWASVGVIILSIITGEGGNIGFRMNKDAALEEAEECLRYGAYSYEGLIEELNEYRGFAEDTAVFAADNCGADWNEQAVQYADRMLDYGYYSYDGVVKLLKQNDFTEEQAVYGADNCGADWFEQAAKCAKNYLDYTSFSKSGLIDQLEFEGFTEEQAEFGAKENGFT